MGISVNETRKVGGECAMAQKRSWCANRVGIVYFVSCDQKDYPVKIGWTVDLRQRLQGLQAGLPFKVVVLAEIPGTPDLERSLHISFNAHRLEGEWFSRHPELMEYIHLHRNSHMWL